MISSVYLSVKVSEIQNWRSLNAFWKFARPTNLGGEISDQLLNDTQTIWVSG